MRSLTVPMFVLVALAALLVGCAGAPKVDPNYKAYADIVDKQEAAAQARFASLGAAAQHCETDACRERIASNLAIVIAATNGGGGQGKPEQYRRQHHPAWGILGAVAPQVIPGLTSMRANDNARDIALGQYSFLGNVIRDVTQSPALQSPNITAGGHIVYGEQRIGDEYGTYTGRDAIGGDQQLGDNTSAGRDQIAGDQRIGDDIGRDAIAGDQHVGDTIGRDDNSGNAGNVGDDNRIGSDGPFDNDTDNGDRCEGDNCQGVPPPPEDPEAPDPDEPVDPGGPIAGPPPGG